MVRRQQRSDFAVNVESSKSIPAASVRRAGPNYDGMSRIDMVGPHQTNSKADPARPSSNEVAYGVLQVLQSCRP